MSLLAELKRRNVLKVGAAYLVVAWLLIQVAATVAPQLQLPEWVPRLITLLLLIGFPITLLLAWFLERAPDGLRVDPAPHGNKRMLVVSVLLIVLAVGWYFRGQHTGAPPQSGQTAADHLRLAVLPLANFSPDPANAFFADGLHDDILTALSRLQGIDVISRTTMQTFKDSKKKLSEIAGEIGATHVIEGSVRRDALRVRLTVQLIDARTDGHLWAETFDRPLDDSLTLQSAVAKEVAEALRLKIGRAGTDVPPTTVPGAYDMYLKARLEVATQPRFGDAAKYLDAALLLDPQFTQARAYRATITAFDIWNFENRRAELGPQLEADLEQVRRERPDLLELGVAEAFHAYYVKRDYPEALERIEKALARDPNHVGALEARAYLLRRVDRIDEALTTLQRTVELDPKNVQTVGELADTLALMRRYRDATAVLDAAILQFPDSWHLQLQRDFNEYNRTGDRGAMLQAFERLRGRVPDDEWNDAFLWFSGPSAESQVRNAPRAAEWVTRRGGSLYPRALDLARDAEFFGDTAQRDRYAAQAAAMFATLAPEVLARPGVRLSHAYLLALRGDSATAIAQAEQALAGSPRSKDAIAFALYQWLAARVYARAGAKGRALDLLEAIHAAPDANFDDTSIRDDYTLRQLLGDEPRYQALMQTIESGFERP